MLEPSGETESLAEGQNQTIKILNNMKGVFI